MTEEPNINRDINVIQELSAGQQSMNKDHQSNQQMLHKVNTTSLPLMDQ